RSVISYGGWITVSGIIGPLMVYGDRFLISTIVGPEALPSYAIPQEALQRLLIIPAALAVTAFPTMASTRSVEERKKIHRKFSAYTIAMMPPILAIVALTASDFLTSWISED